jgi:hypothetical protein
MNAMAKAQPPIPEVLPISPISLDCPLCGAKPGHDCETTSGGFSAVHIDRIKAATRADKKNQGK